MSDINAWVKTRIDFDLRPDFWNEYVAKIDELRLDANDLVLDTIKCIDDLYKKKILNKGRWDKVVSKMQMFKGTFSQKIDCQNQPLIHIVYIPKVQKNYHPVKITLCYNCYLLRNTKSLESN